MFGLPTMHNTCERSSFSYYVGLSGLQHFYLVTEQEPVEPSKKADFKDGPWSFLGQEWCSHEEATYDLEDATVLMCVRSNDSIQIKFQPHQSIIIKIKRQQRHTLLQPIQLGKHRM